MQRDEGMQRLAHIEATARRLGLPSLTAANAGKYPPPNLNTLKGEIHSAERNADDGRCVLWFWQMKGGAWQLDRKSWNAAVTSHARLAESLEQTKARRQRDRLRRHRSVTAERSEAAQRLIAAMEGRSARQVPTPYPRIFHRGVPLSIARGYFRAGAVANVSGGQRVGRSRPPLARAYVTDAVRAAGKPKPYQATVWRGNMQVSLGTFATAEEAALVLARTPEGGAAAAATAAAASMPTPVPKLEPPKMPDDAVVKEEEEPPAWPEGAVVAKTEVEAAPSIKHEPSAMPGMPGHAAVKQKSPSAGAKRQRLGSL